MYVTQAASLITNWQPALSGLAGWGELRLKVRGSRRGSKPRHPERQKVVGYRAARTTRRGGKISNRCGAAVGFVPCSARVLFSEPVGLKQSDRFFDSERQLSFVQYPQHLL